MVANIINEVLFGSRYKHDACEPLMKYVADFNYVGSIRASNRRLKVVLQAVDNLSDSKGMMLGLGLPILTRLPITSWYTFGKFQAAMQKACCSKPMHKTCFLLLQINSYIVDNVKVASKNYSVEDEPTCFVQAYKQRIGQNSFLE